LPLLPGRAEDFRCEFRSDPVELMWCTVGTVQSRGCVSPRSLPTWNDCRIKAANRRFKGPLTLTDHPADRFLGGEMCGIAVAVGWDNPDVVVRRLIAGMLHRGDITDPLVVVGAGIAMCTRRLRIVDPARGVQPKVSFDQRYLVAFNGEIYNHVALRRELEEHGVRFHSDSDTEVVANALRVWGPSGVRRLAGMYAFVAIDAATGEFLAARDPFGVKPLYLVKSDRGFLFCSEIRPLLEATETGDVLLLPPGHLLTRDFCGRHYQLPAAEAAAGGATSPRELDRIVSDAVRIRIPPDLPVAMLFSGGLDSTLIMHYARRFSPSVPAYVAVSSANAPDRAHAWRYADATGLDLREVSIGAETDERLLTVVESVVAAVETFEPAVIRPSLHTYLLSRRIHQDGFRVALCGEGADELFAGYEPLEEAFAHSYRAGRSAQIQCLGMMHRANLQRIDRCAMRFQLEVREPFLDQSIVAYAAGLGRSALFERHGKAMAGKAPLRALYDLYPSDLPAAIRDRKKLPFHEGAGIEGSRWIDLLEDVVSDAELRDGQREFAEFAVANKEELFLLRALAATMDVRRVAHLRGRLRLEMPLAA
jgi:asparagine synthase (glutamine-hydrolysing)